MKAFKYYLPVAAVAALLMAVSCAEFEEGPATPEIPSVGDGKMVNVSLSMTPAAGLNADGTPVSVVPFGGTRTAPATVEEFDYLNVWVFQFNGTGDDAVLVGAPYYVNETAIQDAKVNNSGVVVMPLIDSEGAVHRLVFLANIGPYSWSMNPAQSTYADLKARYLTISSEPATYNNASECLLLSGTTVTKVAPDIFVDGGTGDGTGLGVPLERNLARLELKLSIDGDKAPGYRVMSVKLRNVERRYDIFHSLLELADDAVYPARNVQNLLDYEAVVNSDPSQALVDQYSTEEEGTFVWYVPRNTRGVQTGSTSSATKNQWAPEGSTFFEIVALDENDRGMVFRVYPGANNHNDFNIIPNRNYSIGLTIVGNGGDYVVDSRIEQYSDIVFEGWSNSYILNPPLTGMSPRMFSVPVLQVNRYWNPGNNGYYGGMLDDVLKENTGWKVDLLWQDDADIVRPYNAGDAENYVMLTKSSGQGGSGLFTISVPAAAKHGNFTVVLRKAGDSQIWWSWHFWVTDYNPDPRFVVIQRDKFTYPVTGGQVERYVSKRFGYSHDYSSGTDKMSIWNQVTYDATVTDAASLAKSVMMDRNLGALNSSYNTQTTRTNLYYQFGRKDPFPGNIALYDINGSPLANNVDTTAPLDFQQQYWVGSNANAQAAPTDQAQGYNIKHSIRNPMVFLTNASGDWSQMNENAYGWLDPLVEKTNYTSKSIFDPCPEGWRLPGPNTWPDMATARGNVLDSGRDLGWGTGFYYWPMVPDAIGDFPRSGTIFYPAAGYRNYSSGGLGTGGGDVNVWSSSPASASSGSNLNASSTNVSPANSNTRSGGFSVRCASE